MTAYALLFHRRLNAAMLGSRARIGDVNAQVEDSLAGIRTVQSFTGEEAEQGASTRPTTCSCGAGRTVTATRPTSTRA